MEKELEFGTGGIRAVMGPGKDQLNNYTIRKNTEGYARYIEAAYAGNVRGIGENVDTGFAGVDKSVVIAYDNRNHSAEFAAETAKVLAGHGIKVYLFDSLRPTPELSFAVRYLHAFGGIVITASHNPPEYNGYKIYDRFGCQCVPRDTDEIIKYIKGVGSLSDDRVNGSNATDGFIIPVPDEVDEAYYQAVETVLQRPDLKKDIRIVYSPLHGTGYVPVTTMLGRLGYEVYEVSEQCEPDGEFSHTTSPNPEDRVAFDLAIEMAREVDADLVLATDPDCDRIGLVVRHENDYTYLTGNQTGAVFIKYLLDAKKESGTLPDNGIIFDTIVTSDLGTRIAKSYGVEVESTLTGFKYIGDKIREYEGEKTFLFGYEESYGYMIGDFTRDKDGVQAAVFAAEVCNYYNSHGLTMVDVLESIFEEYGRCSDGQMSETLPGDDGRRRMEELVEEYRSIDPTDDTSVVEGRRVVAVEDYSASVRRELDGSVSKLDLPESNVVKLILEDGSWVVVRPSGNEPKIKYYKELYV